MRRIAALTASIAVVAGVLVSGPVTATAAICTGTVQIDAFTFDPPIVAAGQLSTATLVARNCTGQPVQAMVLWSARYLGAGTGIPPGCPAIDPLATGLALPANGVASTGLTYRTFASCAATGLQVTATVSAGGSTLASRTATLTIGAPSTCAVSYARQSEWPGGFVARITIANTGTVPVTGWTLAFTFPGDQVIGNAWSATVRQSGTAVTATAAAYNQVIAPGATTSFGFQGTWHNSDASPTAFTLNGTACTSS